jgi:(p)ppGpp synthase/HD superfamily hydrolase
MSYLITQSAKFAREAHHGQFRKYSSKIPYIVHPARVAARVMTLHQYTEMQVCVAWLHDVVEDCGVDLKDIENEFGFNISYGVFCLTNHSRNFPNVNRETRKALDRQHLKFVEDNIRIIKFIDRIDNLRDMVNAPADFIDLYLRESDLLVNECRLLGLDESLDREYNDAVQFLHKYIRL